MRKAWDREIRVAVAGVVVGMLASCASGTGSDDGNDTVSVRLSPMLVESTGDAGGASAWALFDRDTEVGWAPAMQATGTRTRLRIALGGAATITHLKVFGPSPYVLDV